MLKSFHMAFIKDRPAFTLVELAIIIVVVGIIAVFSSLAINTVVKSIQLTGAAYKLVSDMRYAQNMANATGKWYGISFEVSPANTYTLYTTTGTLDTVISDPTKPGSDFNVDLYEDFSVSISTLELGSGNKVEFHPLGTPYDDKEGNIISPEGIVVLTRDSSSKTVRITKDTGRVYLQ